MENARPTATNTSRYYDDQEAELDITLSVAGAQTLLRQFRSVRTLYIRYQPDEDDGPGRPYTVTTISIETMFSVLGDHPNIEHLVLDNLGEMEGDINCQCQFPIRALTLFVNKAKKLKSLQLDMDTPIAGSPEDGQGFLEAISENATLDVLEIGDFGSENSPITASEYSPINVAKWVELTISHTGDQITADQVERSIIHSTCLRKLLIDTSNGGFPKQHLARIMEGLRNNVCHITELNLLDDFNEHRAIVCAKMIRENTTLNHLFVSLGNEPRNGSIITKALQQNSQIHSLRFVLSSQPNSEARTLVHNLRHNQTVRRIHFHFQGRSNQARVHESYLTAFEEIIDDNHTLVDIRMDKCHGAFDLTPKIEFGLSLNRAGRKELLQASDQSRYRSLWVDKVIENRANEGIVFYFLSQNPSFLPYSQAVTPVEGMNPRKRKMSDR